MSTSPSNNNTNNADGPVTPDRMVAIARDELEAYLNAAKAVKQDLGVDTKSVDVIAALMSMYKDLKANANKNLKKAEIDRIAMNMIGQYLDQETDERYVVPIVGRGGGRDCKPKEFYRGNGFPPRVCDLTLSCGVLTTCDEMAEDAKAHIKLKVAEKMKRGVAGSIKAMAKQFMDASGADDAAVTGPPCAKRPRLGEHGDARSEPEVIDLTSLDESSRNKVIGFISGLQSAGDGGGKPRAK